MNAKDNIFGTLIFIAQKWTIKGDSILKEKAGLTIKQWKLLVILEKEISNNYPTISETAKAYGTSRQNLKQVALSLQKKGIVEIKSDKKDSRIQRISLTGKHIQIFEGKENEEWQRTYINSLFTNLSSDEIIELNRLTEKLTKNL